MANIFSGISDKVRNFGVDLGIKKLHEISDEYVQRFQLDPVPSSAAEGKLAAYMKLAFTGNLTDNQARQLLRGPIEQALTAACLSTKKPAELSQYIQSKAESDGLSRIARFIPGSMSKMTLSELCDMQARILPKVRGMV